MTLVLAALPRTIGHDPAIRTLAFVFLLLAVVAPLARAEGPPVTVLLLRTATGRGAYHFAEVIHERARLVPFDLGYIDFDNPSQYREIWIGGGFKPIASSRLSLTAEGFVAKAYGEHAGGRLYFQPFVLATARLAAHVTAESVYFAYVPLNDAGHAQHVLERAKIEYDFPRFRVGAGYGGYEARGATWQHKPFVTAMVKAPPVGNVEIWVQHLADNHFTMQIRYAKVFLH